MREQGLTEVLRDTGLPYLLLLTIEEIAQMTWKKFETDRREKRFGHGDVGILNPRNQRKSSGGAAMVTDHAGIVSTVALY